MLLVAALLSLSSAMQVRVEVDKRPPQDTARKKTTISIDVGGRRQRDTSTVVKDSTDTPAAGADSANGRHAHHRLKARRLPVTAQVLATAFRNADARTLLERARAARVAQDSSIMSYDATTYQRISASMAVTKLGRDRLIFRSENASRVRWQRNVGTWIDVLGQRAAIPIAPDDAQRDAQREMSADADGLAAVPYYPGQEPLLMMDGGDGSLMRTQVNERELVHPLAVGAEAYYVYEAGDSVDIRLPDRSIVHLRELRVRPRVPKWNVVVGSFWFDAQRGQLVRAAYRFAEPLDVWAVAKEEDPHAMDDVPIWVKPMISPMRGQVTAMTIDYGLYQGRFWLPRSRAVEGSGQMTFIRVPFKFEQHFDYTSVNGPDTLPAIVTAARVDYDTLDDSVATRMRDSVRARRHARADSVRRGLVGADADCDDAGVRTTTHARRDAAGRVVARIAYRVPCDAEKLAHSPALPGSIYDPGDELFGGSDRDALIAQAISLGAQPPFLLGSGHLPPPTIAYGLAFTRYNRVEGFSTGARVDQPLGAGYTASAVARLGTADLEPNAELSLSRTDLVRTWTLTGYNRLAVANDWGDPLSFGSSVSALLFGRDEGFYYRATGAELVREHAPRSDGARISWRLFAEDERSARQETTWSLGPAFTPNIVARAGAWAGTSLRVNQSAGVDPRGWRLLSDVRLEGAAALHRSGDSTAARYARGAADFTISHGLPKSLAGALTLGGGTSAGSLPPQRLWYMGGTQTVRGLRPDTAAAGNAYWLGRAELGYEGRAWRPVLFGDLGWTGDRDRLYRGEIGRPSSGAGAGISFADGLVRMDLAHGIYPQRRWRFDLYLESRF